MRAAPHSPRRATHWAGARRRLGSARFGRRSARHTHAATASGSFDERSAIRAGGATLPARRLGGGRGAVVVITQRRLELVDLEREAGDRLRRVVIGSFLLASLLRIVDRHLLWWWLASARAYVGYAGMSRLRI